MLLGVPQKDLHELRPLVQLAADLVCAPLALIAVAFGGLVA